MESHYVYWLECNQTQQHYIGVRSCKCNPQDDPYMSSSRVVKKMRSQGFSFTKTVIKIFNKRASAVALEMLLHGMFDVARNHNFLNRSRQTTTSFDTTGNIEVALRIGDANRGKDTWNKGSTGIKTSNKGQIPWNKGINTPPRSEETKRKIQESMKKYHKNKFPLV